MRNKISLPTKQSIATHVRRAKRKRTKKLPRATQAQRDRLRIIRLNAKATAGITRRKPTAIDGRYRAGFRTIGGRDCFFRSSWEANYARHLEAERTAGRILAWEHEPKTFYFPDAVRPPRSYTPDFRITLLDGMHEFHEVKGFVDKRLFKILALMKAHYAYYPLKVLDPEGYADLERTRAAHLPGWEFTSTMPKRRRAYSRV